MAEISSAAVDMDTPLKTRKKRSRNFSVDEENTIQSMVESNSRVLNEKHSSEVTNKKKIAIWNEITNAVNMKGVALRTVDEVKEKWSNMGRKAKKTFTDYKLQQRKTGGGPTPAEPSQATSRIIEIMKDSASFSGVPGGLETDIISCCELIPSEAVSAEPGLPSSAIEEEDTTTGNLAESAAEIPDHIAPKRNEARVPYKPPKYTKAISKQSSAERVYELQEKVLTAELENHVLKKRKIALQIQLLEKMLKFEDSESCSASQLFLAMMS